MSESTLVYPFASRIRVRYAETDQMRFVYYANHFVYYEVARTECLASWGFPYSVIEAEGYGIPVLEAHCQYLSPARYGDELVVRVAPSLVDRLRIRFDYETRRGSEDGDLLARGHTIHVCMDREGKPRRPHAGVAACIRAVAESGASPV
jgi:acyl-CoA thioester hydrolase